LPQELHLRQAQIWITGKGRVRRGQEEEGGDLGEVKTLALQTPRPRPSLSALEIEEKEEESRK